MTKKLPFLKHQRRYATDPKTCKTKLARVLAYMLEHCIGFENAKTWPELDLGLRTVGVQFSSKNNFQQSVLKESRETDWLAIASHDDHGYFLMRTSDDSAMFGSYYKPRIAKMQDNWGRVEAKVDATPDNYTDWETENL